MILSFIALAALAIAASRSDLSISAPAGSQRGPAVPAAPDLTDISTPLPMRVGGPAGRGRGARRDRRAGRPRPVAPRAAGRSTPAAARARRAPRSACRPPSEVGGIQSLVRLIPLFGPFSPEAFAMLPAFQPGIDALGPLFPTFEAGLDQLAPVLDAATPVVAAARRRRLRRPGPALRPVPRRRARRPRRSWPRSCSPS